MINTGMTAGLDEATPEFAASLHPVGRLGEPQEPAAAALWLRSDAASFVTSSTLVLDGGYTAA
jgi:NAD(P)-dependent dehydrogenase (short-subunit alcohol dehydrogenase family)